jgi:hypothetical protein
MRVLITGVTARMIGSTRLKYDYLSNVSLIEKALRLAGHEVTTAKVPLDLDVRNNFDVALVGMAKIHSLGAGYFPEACKILDDFGHRAIMYADDWAFVGFGEGVRGALKDFSKYLEWRKYPHESVHLDTMEKVLRKIVHGRSWWPIMLPIFGWGDPSKFLQGNIELPSEAICGFDPSRLYEMPTFEDCEPGQRDYEWVMAAFGKHDHWINKLNLQWPVTYYGNKRQDQEVLTETQIIQRYASRWGILAAKYPKVGCGWWRVRYIHAAVTGSVLLCDKEDGIPIGPSYCTPVSVIESSSADQLKELADSQSKELSAHLPSVREVVEQIDSFVQAVTG